jgi:hypothetical protein
VPRKPELDLDVVAVRKLAVTADAQGEAVLAVEIVGGQVLNLIFSSDAFAGLEALIAKANEKQAKFAPKQ